MIWWILLSLFGIIMFFTIIYLAKVTIDCHYQHKIDDDLLTVQFFLWHIHIYTFTSPLLKFDPASMSFTMEEKKQSPLGQKKETASFGLSWLKTKLRESEKFLAHVTGFYKILRVFLKKIQVKKLEWHSQLGVSDAVLTAYLVGACWSLKGMVVGILSNFFRLKAYPKIQIDPIYQGTITKTNFSCMISFRIGHAISAGIMILLHWQKIKRTNQNQSNVMNSSM
ncbi:DUF2953 domain-containing protein [Alkalihalobacillus pseudalcaliphilus]|uniref:DUF2953 domain-containing protein n=1 Tax=Alkalihalobacillus pseudalcaliphilus TaxID=79884 RepID=UPI00069E300C|nr:DUF2953 domain-containing protein [Alkalihalobacillus pseudalcaliphilus]